MVAESQDSPQEEQEMMTSVPDLLPTDEDFIMMQEQIFANRNDDTNGRKEDDHDDGSFGGWMRAAPWMQRDEH